MAKDQIIIVREAVDFTRLSEGDKFAFVKDADNNSVFVYEKSSGEQYNNAFLACILKGDEIIPVALSVSSILAPYGKTAPFLYEEKDGKKSFMKNLNVGFHTSAKRQHSTLRDAGTVIKISRTAIVQFTSKKGESVDWNCYELSKTNEKFVPNESQISEITEWVQTYLSKQTKKMGK
jgi:hypothetical protein